MTGPRLGLLGKLAAMDEDDKERRAATPRAQRELDEARESQERMNVMDEESETDQHGAADHPHKYEAGARKECLSCGLVRPAEKGHDCPKCGSGSWTLRSPDQENARLRAANIRLNGELIEARGTIQRLERKITKLEEETQ